VALCRPRRASTLVAVGYLISRIKGQDGGVLAELRLAALLDTPWAFASTYESELGLSLAQWSERARRGATGGDAATFVATEGDHGVGLVSAFRARDDPSSVELVSMWTAPSARRRGIGSALVAAVLNWAAEAGPGRVSLWVAEDNDAAINLYAAQGFTRTRDTQPLPSDPVRMELRMQCLLGT